MSNLIKAPINYAVSAGGQFVKGGSVLFGFINIRPDADNPATLKPIYLDSALNNQAANPQGLSSDAVFDQSDNGVLFGITDDSYSVIIYDANGDELSYIPVYELSDATAAASAQTAAADAIEAKEAAEIAAVAAGLSYDEFVNRYFGAYATDPALDPSGNAPIEGSMYWDTSGTPRFKVFTAGFWIYPPDMALGTMSLVDKQTSPTDTTTGRGLTTDALGANGGPVFDDVTYQPEVSFGVGVVRLMNNNSGSDISGGASTAGSSLRSAVFIADGSIIFSVSSTGTWKNISGGTCSATRTREFVRTA